MKVDSNKTAQNTVNNRKKYQINNPKTKNNPHNISTTPTYTNHNNSTSNNRID